MSLEKFQLLSEEKQGSIVAAGINEFSQKSYADASTDAIVHSCGISKGLLFHYFGSKKNFYLYCLTCSLEKLLEKRGVAGEDFYDILFSVMDQKVRLCMEHPAETRFVNMASRESALEVAQEKAEIIARYAIQTQKSSKETLARAISTLPLKAQGRDKAAEGLSMYINTVMSRYLLSYQYTPDKFFENTKQIQAELRNYIDLMLYGIIEEASNEENRNV